MQTLEARHAIGDHVAVNFGYAGHFGAAEITGVHFTKNKVKYDVQIKVGEEHHTRLYNIESDFVITRQEWLEWNQSRPSYGTENYVKETLMPAGKIEQRRVTVLDGFVVNGYDTHPEQQLLTNNGKVVDASCSVEVIIDPDGTKQNIRTGFYDYANDAWVIFAEDSFDVKIDPKYMVWIYNPLTHPQYS